MITNISKKLLLAGLTISLSGGLIQLDGMNREREVQPQEAGLPRQLCEELLEEVRLVILLNYCELFEPNIGPDRIISLIKDARRVFGLSTRSTVLLVQGCLGAQKKSLCDMQNGDKKTALYLAVDSNDLDTVRIICLAADNDYMNLICCLDNRGNSAFHTAACRGFDEIVKVQLSAAREKYEILLRFRGFLDFGSTALHEATRCGCLEVVKTLLNKAPTLDLKCELMTMKSYTYCNAVGYTCLHFAECHPDIMELFFQEAQDQALYLIMFSDNDETPLHVVAKTSAYGNRGKTARILLEVAGQEAKRLCDMTTKDGKKAIDYALAHEEENREKIEMMMKEVDYPVYIDFVSQELKPYLDNAIIVDVQNNNDANALEFI